MSTSIGKNVESFSARRTITGGMWAWVILVVINRVFFVAFNGLEVDDFSNLYHSIERFTSGQ